jgi:hypothetical protein
MTGTSPRKAGNDGTSSLGDLLAHGALERCAAERPTVRTGLPAGGKGIRTLGPTVNETPSRARPRRQSAITCGGPSIALARGTTVLTRLCIDRLRARDRERDTYPGYWLPEMRPESQVRIGLPAGGLEGDGFELLVPPHESPRFPKKSGADSRTAATDDWIARHAQDQVPHSEACVEEIGWQIEHQGVERY